MNVFIIVDVQYDFCPGGALAVPGGNDVIPEINAVRDSFDVVVLTQDWHPPQHKSFASQHPGESVGAIIDLNGLPQILWPDHCVQGSRGAEFHADLIRKPTDLIFRKGTDPQIDSYSAFYDNNHLKSTGLGEKLNQLGVKTITLAGLATDYCVKFSALDALALNVPVRVLARACRGVDLRPGDSKLALEEMARAGVIVE